MIFPRRTDDDATSVSLAIAEEALARLAEMAMQEITDGTGFIRAVDVQVTIGAAWIQLERLKS